MPVNNKQLMNNKVNKINITNYTTCSRTERSPKSILAPHNNGSKIIYCKSNNPWMTINSFSKKITYSLDDKPLYVITGNLLPHVSVQACQYFQCLAMLDLETLLTILDTTA